MCYCYILYSSTLDRYYVGHTCETLPERIRKHNSIHKGYTGKATDWELVYKEQYSTQGQAYKREREIKSHKSRKIIEKLISSVCSEHPDS